MAYISFQPNDYFNTKLYTGTGSAQSITGVGFQPDWCWLKSRASANHRVFDAVRGATKAIYPSLSNAEGTSSAELNAFNSDGFTLGSEANVNANGVNFVSWNWKANGQGSANTAGSINTTYTSVDTTSGFSISTYTGTGSNATVGHGLGAVPNIVLVKRLDATSDWRMYHSAAGAGSPATKQLFLNTTGAEDDDNTIWNDTAPTSSLFTVGTNTGGNASGGTYVAYCFAEKKGFSKFSSFVGNGNADGTFVFCGFKPAFVMLKKSSASGDNWSMLDNKRNTFNVMDKFLDPNSSNAEGTGDIWDFTSNGFKMRNTFTGYNASGATYIFMAFAEEPLVSSNGVPATAR